jgi:mannitol/fructose-specific phosphotransferase system IIA component (Ntr-type)
MNLKPFLTADRIIMDVQSGSQRDIFTALIQPLIDAEIVTDADEFLADLERREAECTTVMDHGVAIPHARSHAVKRLGLTVGLVPAADGISFDPDSDPVILFFCIAIPSYAPTAHIPLLQALAKFSRDDKRVAKVLVSKTPAVAARYLSSFKG